MRRFTSTLAVAAAALVALTATAAPAAAEAVGYRVDFWAYYGSWAVQSYGTNLTNAITTDLAGVFGTSASAVTLKDCILSPNTQNNISAVFTVDGGSDATFMASTSEQVATWANATNELFMTLYNSVAERKAAAASVDEYYSAAWIVKVTRLGSASVLPKKRFLEVKLHGKHLVTATGYGSWEGMLLMDLATAFGMVDYMTRLSLTNSTLGGVNNTELTVRFTVMPVLNTAVNGTTFFASNGTVSWLSNCESLHANAYHEDAGLPPMRRSGAAMDASEETALTVTATGVAPGDEDYTSPTPAPGGAAGGVTVGAYAVASAALLGASMLMF